MSAITVMNGIRKGTTLISRLLKMAVQAVKYELWNVLEKIRETITYFRAEAAAMAYEAEAAAFLNRYKGNLKVIHGR